MWTRAVAVWFAMLLLAIANGALREAAISPRVGSEAGHALSSITLSLAVLGLALATITWIAPATSSDAWAIGIMWVCMTLAFEFVAGHYAFKKPWPELFADYNVLRGRIWILVLLVTLVSPVMAARLRR